MLSMTYIRWLRFADLWHQDWRELNVQAFELLSLGDGNYFRRHNPQFSVVEIARMENELQAAPHPLNLAAHPVADAPVGMA